MGKTRRARRERSTPATMGKTRRAGRERSTPATTTDQPAWRQYLVAVGVVQHPTTGHYQVWLYARGQTTMLLAYRTPEQADAAKEALGEALVRGDFATPERWCAAVDAIGADADAPLEPVSEAVFAAITASVQGAKLVIPDEPAPDSTTSSEAPGL